ncbi:MAG: CbiX/SirB N-terminal domain-containing protein [Hydrogenophilus sp.]|nr:CbiX/SirB N-terminal domain-containing protein [Hydrogenophilus sp.]
MREDKMGKEGVVLFGHGARDPAWAEPMQAVARAIEASASNWTVRCAFLEFLPPTLPEVVEELACDHRRVVVVPWFIAPGGHLQRDLPAMVAELTERFRPLEIEVWAAVGSWPAVQRAMAEAVVEAIAGRRERKGESADGKKWKGESGGRKGEAEGREEKGEEVFRG